MIVFRCDANPALGFGHLMRCSQFSGELRRRGHRTAMYGDLPEHANAGDSPPFDLMQPAPMWRGAAQDVDGLMDFAASVDARALVVDHPAADGQYQALLKSRNARWLHFMARPDTPVLADLVFCANAAADPDAFARLDNTGGTEWLVGPEYALLRSQFRGLPRRTTRERIGRVLVSFGGGSDRKAFRKTLPVLLSEFREDCCFTLIAGSGNPDLPWLEDYASSRRGRVDLRIDEERIADLMLASDLAVMASGTTTLEAAACGLPMILLAIAENQIEPARAWERRGAALYLGESDALAPGALIEACGQMQAAERRERQTRALYEAGVDGRGVERVADAVERHLLQPAEMREN